MNLELLNQWLQPAAIAVGAVVLTLLAYAIVRPIVVRINRRAPVLQAVMQRLHHSLQWALPLLTLQAVWAGVADTLPAIDAVRHINLVLLIGAYTAAAIAVVRGVADAVELRHPQDVKDNLDARRILTQTKVLTRIVTGVLLFAGVSFMLLTFPGAQRFGASLLASAGLSALVIGIAARSVFGNLLAGVQIALAQPIRIDDVLIIEGEWGRVEEIRGTYVVLKIWDERRLVIPLQWFIEHPFQNWTRSSAQIIGSVMLWLDYGTDLAPLRAEAQRLAASSKDYDGRVCVLQVVESTERTMQVRILVSSPSSGENFDLRCLVREGLIAFVQRTQPGALPRLRAEVHEARSANAERGVTPAQPTEDDAAFDAKISEGTGTADLGAPTGGVGPAQASTPAPDGPRSENR